MLSIDLQNDSVFFNLDKEYFSTNRTYKIYFREYYGVTFFGEKEVKI